MDSARSHPPAPRALPRPRAVACPAGCPTQAEAMPQTHGPQADLADIARILASDPVRRPHGEG